MHACATHHASAERAPLRKASSDWSIAACTSQAKQSTCNKAPDDWGAVLSKAQLVGPYFEDSHTGGYRQHDVQHPPFLTYSQTGKRSVSHLSLRQPQEHIHDQLINKCEETLL